MRFLILFALLTLAPLSAEAAKRLGLIIGNDIYAEVPSLEKARSDATGMSETLSAVGFETITVLDADRRMMNRAIAEFTAKLRPGDTALVFFAGHGVEIAGENYLLPTDIVSPGEASEDFVKFESISLSDLLARVQSTGARTTLMFLDACRDNPFAAVEGGRSIGSTRGLGRITAPEGTFVVFSAGARQQALDSLHGDDRDKNSVFTRLLLPKLTRPGLELRQMIAELRVEVRDLAQTRQHSQFPAYYDELLGEFFFADAAAPVETALATPAPQPMTPEIENNIHEDFRLTKSVNTPIAYRAFLRRYVAYPDVLPVTLARQLLESLEAEASATQNRRVSALDVKTESDSTTDEPARALALAAEPPEPEQQQDPELNDPLLRREIIRQTQDLLNAHGCQAGAADGIIGRKTRAAFARFNDQSGAPLSADALGTKAALDMLRSKTIVVCTKPIPVAAAAPKPKTAPVAIQPKATTPKALKKTPAPKPAAAPTPKATSVSLAGRWKAYTDGCTDVRKIRATMKKLSATSYRFSSQIVGMPSDFGSRGIVRVNGRKLRGDLSSDMGTAGGWTGTLSSNGKSFTVTESSGCTYTFKR